MQALAAFLHLPLGLAVLLGPFSLALIIMLTLELTVIRPANRTDTQMRTKRPEH